MGDTVLDLAMPRTGKRIIEILTERPDMALAAFSIKRREPPEELASLTILGRPSSESAKALTDGSSGAPRQE